MKAKLTLVVVSLLVSSLLAPSLVSMVHAACSTTCSFEADVNIPASEGRVWVQLGLSGSGFYSLNHTFAFAYNSSQYTLEVKNTTLSVPSTGARYVFREWVYKCLSPCTGGDIHFGTYPANPTPTILTTPLILNDYTSASYGPFVAVFDKQFQASLSFTDPSGVPISPPSSLTLQGTSAITLTSYVNQWLSIGVWTVTDATWQGTPGSVYGSPTIDMTGGPRSAQVPLKAYSAAIKVVDTSNNPVIGANLSVSLTNGTLATGTTDSQGMVQLGHIPLGIYSVHVTYQGQDVQQQADASRDPVLIITLNGGGGTSAPVVSGLVLLTIFGLAAFLLILAVKVRKPPPPPII